MIKSKNRYLLMAVAILMYIAPLIAAGQDTVIYSQGNPVIRHVFTADPAAMVYKDRVYLYTGHDEAPVGHNGYVMHNWLCFSSADMVNWTEHKPIPMDVKTFKWARDDAWASQVIERDGKFYWYVAVEHATIPGKAIGVDILLNRQHVPIGRNVKDDLEKALLSC